MCKSQAEGGQRCSGHAKERMDTLLAKGEQTMERLGRGEITMEQARAVHAQVTEAMIDYASTPEGAVSFRQDLADGEAYYAASGDPDGAAANDEIRRLIDEGAARAQANREAENDWRATRGFKALTTPVPQTLAQERAAADAEAARAAATAAWAADPLGLRAEQAHLRPVAAHPATYRSPTEAREGMLDMKAVEQIKTDIDSPRYGEVPRGIRARLARRSENADAMQRGARFGAAFTAAAEKYDGRFDVRQIERAAQLLTLHAPANSDTQQFVAAHLDSTLSRAAWTLQPDPSISGETLVMRSSSATPVPTGDAPHPGYGVKAEFDLPSDRPQVREPNLFERTQERIAFLDESDLPQFRSMVAGGM